MYRNVYFHGVQRRPVNQQHNEYAQNPIPHREYPQFKEFSPEANAAIMAYASPIIKKPYEKMSLNDNILRLKKEGKREGIDYNIEGCKMGNIVLYINNKNGQPKKVLHYDNGNVENVDCYETYQYQNGREVRCQAYADDKIRWYNDTYYNDEIPQENFTKEGFNYNTTPNEYIDYLKQNNIKYKIEYEVEENNNRTIYLTEYAPDGKETQCTWWYYGKRQFCEPADIVSRDLLNDNEQTIKSISFDKDSTSVRTYLKNLDSDNNTTS